MLFRALSALLLALFLAQPFLPKMQQAKAAGGFTSGALGTALNGGSVSDILVQGFKGAAIGAVSASLTFGIGHDGVGGNSIFQSFGKVGETIGKGVAHGLVQGGMSKLQAGNFASGAIGGALSSVGGSFYEGKGLTHSAIRVAVAAVAGGTAAEIAGGDFVNSAISGAYVQMFNDLVYLLDRDAVPLGKDFDNPTAGHAALLVGSETEGWTYYSFGLGRDENWFTTNNNLDMLAIDPMSINDAVNWINTRNDGPHRLVTHGSNYDDWLYFKTSTKQDGYAHFKVLAQYSQQTYNVIWENCGDTCANALRRAGVKFKGAYMPVEHFKRNMRNADSYSEVYGSTQ